MAIVTRVYTSSDGVVTITIPAGPTKVSYWCISAGGPGFYVEYYDEDEGRTIRTFGGGNPSAVEAHVDLLVSNLGSARQIVVGNDFTNPQGPISDTPGRAMIARNGNGQVIGGVYNPNDSGSPGQRLQPNAPFTPTSYADSIYGTKGSLIAAPIGGSSPSWVDPDGTAIGGKPGGKDPNFNQGNQPGGAAPSPVRSFTDTVTGITYSASDGPPGIYQGTASSMTGSWGTGGGYGGNGANGPNGSGGRALFIVEYTVPETKMPAGSASFAVTGQAANLKRSYRMTAGATAFVLTGRAATTARGVRLTATVATFALTGRASAGAQRRGSGATSYVATGSAALAARRGGAAASAFVLTGRSAVLSWRRFIVAAPAAFALTGRAAALVVTRRYVMTATAGTLNLSGQPAGTRIARTNPAAYARFDLAGQPASLRRAVRMSANAASFDLVGRAANLRRDFRVAGATGTFVATAQSAAQALRRVATPAPFLATGWAATARRTSPAPGSDLTLSTYAARAARRGGAAPATLALDGATARARNTRRAAPGGFSVAGAPATRSRSAAAEAGAIALTGFAATYRLGLVMRSDRASFETTGEAAGSALVQAKRLAADPAGFDLAGRGSSASIARASDGTGGRFDATGGAANLRRDLRLTAERGTLALVGQASRGTRNLPLDARLGRFFVTGHPGGAATARSHRVGMVGVTGGATSFRLVRAIGPTAFALTGRVARGGVRHTLTAGSAALVINAAAVNSSRRAPGGGATVLVAPRPAGLYLDRSIPVPVYRVAQASPENRIARASPEDRVARSATGPLPSRNAAIPGG